MRNKFDKPRELRRDSLEQRRTSIRGRGDDQIVKQQRGRGVVEE